MEFPDLGANCAVPTCKMLSFLPVRCSGCQGLFCKNHYPFDRHNCKTPDIKDKQVPVCPLCGALIPIRPGELPDVRVGNHIDSACQSKPALELKGKLFTYSCCVPRCKKKELVPFSCDRCKLNFCVMHRNELDHGCKGVQANQNSSRRLSAAGAAAVHRVVFNKSLVKKNQESSVFNQIPICSNSFATGSELQEEEDRQLALALAASLSEVPNAVQRQTSQTNSSNSGSRSSCNLS